MILWLISFGALCLASYALGATMRIERKIKKSIEQTDAMLKRLNRG